MHSRHPRSPRKGRGNGSPGDDREGNPPTTTLTSKLKTSCRLTMNSFEKWYCGSALWRYLTRRELLPWMLQGTALGDHVLELGAGPGAATIELARRAPRVTSLEYDHALALKLRARVNRSMNHSNVSIIQGDAVALPFPDGTFSSAIAILMLHHLKSREQQDRTFSEVRRMLRPGGVFLDRKSTRLNSSHVEISYAVFCLKKKKKVHLAN